MGCAFMFFSVLRGINLFHNAYPLHNTSLGFAFLPSIHYFSPHWFCSWRSVPQINDMHTNFCLRLTFWGEPSLGVGRMVTVSQNGTLDAGLSNVSDKDSCWKVEGGQSPDLFLCQKSLKSVKGIMKNHGRMESCACKVWNWFL